jgi:hypothetical protein
MLRTVVARLRPAPPETVANATKQASCDEPSVDMVAFLAAAGHPCRPGKILSRGARVYQFERCPFDPDHGRKASIMIGRSGKPLFRCFHDGASGCSRHTWADFLELVGKADPFGDCKALRPEIVTNNQLSLVSDSCKELLEKTNEPTTLFQRRGRLVMVRRSRAAADQIKTSSDATVADVTPDLLSHRLHRLADFVTRDARGGKHPVHVPPRILSDLMVRGDFDVPELIGITTVPVLRGDGTVLDTPGYDPVTQLLYAPAADLVIPPIPRNPTAEDVAQAVALLEEVLHDFPFDGAASKANAVALALTAVARALIAGNVPAAVIGGNKPGVGKGMLNDVISLIVSGTEPPKCAAPTTDDELRKRLTALLLAGVLFIVIDNLKRPFDFESADAFLTCGIWSDRKLGASEQIEVLNRSILVLTGNNIHLGPDMSRRSYLINLRTPEPRPAERGGFLHDPLKPWVLANRGRLIAALLTICSAWHAAGQPRSATRMGSFEDWAAIVGGMLEIAGIEGFLQNRKDFQDAAGDKDKEWEQFLEAIGQAVGFDKLFTVQHLVSLMDLDNIQSFVEVREALPAFLKTKIRDSKDTFKLSAELGKNFGYKEGEPFGNQGIFITRGDKKATGGRSQWMVRRMRPNGAG